MGAIKREMGDAKWMLGAIGFQTGLAYVVSLIIYQLGLVAFYGKGINFWTIVAVVLLIVIIYFIVRKPAQEKEEVITLDNLEKFGE